MSSSYDVQKADGARDIDRLRDLIEAQRAGHSQAPMGDASDLTDHDAFDAFADQHGWSYDNGWSFEGEAWDSHYAPERFRGLQMLRRAPGRIVVIRVGGEAHTAIWSGEVTTARDFEAMIARLGELLP